MSAEILRRAAALMRERAEAALRGPWESLQSEHELGFFDVVQPADMDREVAARVVPVNAEHIASWHPAVALAVADWLEGVAERHVAMGHPAYGVLCCATCNLDLEDDERGHCDDFDDALTVARAYLGEQS